MADHGLWVMRESVEGYAHNAAAFGMDSSNRTVNGQEFDAALTELRYTRSLQITGDTMIPDGFPRPVLSLPPLDFEPDYFTHDSMAFVSRRFRDALAQPPGVVQYWPVDLARASEEARAQDYRLLRILAWQQAMDLERSEYERTDVINRRTGETITRFSLAKRFVPLPGLVPRTEIFRTAEDNLRVLATDALAERVLRAGCDGVSFEEPETIGMRDVEPRRLRTAEGVIVLDADLEDWARMQREKAKAAKLANTR